MDEDLDTHICLGCQLTVIGLDQYITHKQLHCPARKNFLPSPSTTTLCVDIDETVLSTSLLSPVAGRAVDPNMVLNRKPSAVSEFFSSLELQCRPLMDKLEECDTKNCDDDDDEMLDQQKALKIASILSDLEFSSDSEVLAIDDNLLDFSDDEEDDEDDSLPPTHIGGKWKPGSGPPMRGEVSGKTSGKLGNKWVKGGKQSRGGKWRPGEHPGKLSAYYKRTSHGQGRCGKLEAYLAQGEMKGAVPEHRKNKQSDFTPDNAIANDDITSPKRNGKVIVEEIISRDNLTDVSHVEDVSIAECTDDRDTEPKHLETYAMESSHCIDSMNHEDIITKQMEIDKTCNEVDTSTDQNETIENDIRDAFETVDDNEYDIKHVNNLEVNCEESNVEAELDSEVTVEIGEDQSVDDLTCRVCNRHFVRLASYHKHLQTTLHAKRVTEDNLSKSQTTNMITNDDDNVTDDSDDDDNRLSVKLPIVVDIDCPICWKHFTNKYNFIRHLLTTYHLRRVHQSSEPFVLAECYQVQLLRQSTKFQCRICSFYCQESLYLCEHMSSDEHVSRIGSLMGPLLCPGCRFKTHDNLAMLNHLQTIEHSKCVVRELRYRIECPECAHVVHSAAQLSSHMKSQHKVHTKDGLLCSHCGVHFSSRVHLARHVRQRHTRPHHCQPCGAAFADAYTLRLHASSKRHLDNCLRLGSSGKAVVPTRSAGQFKCDHCAFTTPEYSRLRPHYMRVHAGHAHACNVCGRTFSSRQRYSVHLASARHKQRESEAAAADNTDVHTCSACGLKFYTSQQFALHEMTHANMVSERTLKTAQGNEYPGVDERYHKFLRDLPAVRTRRVTCPECGRSLVRANLIPHLRQHSGAMMFRCVLCERGYASAGTLRRHLHSHSGVVSHDCPVCAHSFPRRTSLMIHQLRRHPEHACVQQMTTYPCPTCGMLFPARHLLNTHLKTHNTDMQYRCTYDGCKRAFSHSGALKAHMLIHTSLRLFLCSSCGYSARTRQQLTRHTRVHTGERRYVCEHCPYRAASSAHLRRHTRVHAGTCPFKCPHCSYRCNTHENLRKHILRTQLHVGKSVYPCSQCDFGTNDASELRDHLIQTHDANRRGLVMSVQAGIYERDTDVQHVAEGAQVIAVREHGKKTRSKKAARSDHDYTVPTSMPAGFERLISELVNDTAVNEGDEGVSDTMLSEKMVVAGDMVVDGLVAIADDDAANIALTAEEKPVAYLLAL